MLSNFRVFRSQRMWNSSIQKHEANNDMALSRAPGWITESGLSIHTWNCVIIVVWATNYTTFLMITVYRIGIPCAISRRQLCKAIENIKNWLIFWSSKKIYMKQNPTACRNGMETLERWCFPIIGSLGAKLNCIGRDTSDESMRESEG
jgi:hypothetical protein